MSDILLPPHLRHAQTSFRYIDSSAASRPSFNGPLRTAAKGGDRMYATIGFTKHGGQTADERSSRAILQAFLVGLRGKQNRAYLYDHSHRLRGSMPTGELLSNNTFASGSTGYSTGSLHSISAQDRVLRVRRTGVTGGAAVAFGQTAPITVTQYACYAARAFFGRGHGDFVAQGLGVRAGSALFGAEYGQAIATSFGDKTLAFVPRGTAAYFSIGDEVSTGVIAGNYFLVPYVSISRCALVDNGVNSLLRSDEFENGTWVKTNATVNANPAAAPDGTNTADGLVETTATGLHFLHQTTTGPSAATDYFFCIAVKAANRTFVELQIEEGFNPSVVSQYFNLTTKTVGASGTTGAGWSNRRAFAVDLGNDWVLCCIGGRKTTASISVTAYVLAATADGTDNYTGTTASTALYLWRATVAASGVPARLIQTSSSATAGTSQTGSALYTKGWPVSASNLLVAGDQVELITSRGSELKVITAPVSSDAAGLAYMQFEPPLRGSPADNAAVIVHQPMGRFIYSGESPGWENEPGFWSSAMCEFEEAG